MVLVTTHPYQHADAAHRSSHQAGVDPGIISTPADIAAARDRADLPSLAALAVQLGVSRQTLNAWGRTCRVPAWVPLACAGLTALPDDASLT